MNAHQRYEFWMEHLAPDDPMRAELETIRDDEAQITDRFYQEIAFGTAGLRGICGAGTNRMNALTVGWATKGLADYICAYDHDKTQPVEAAGNHNARIDVREKTSENIQNDLINSQMLSMEPNTMNVGKEHFIPESVSVKAPKKQSSPDSAPANNIKEKHVQGSASAKAKPSKDRGVAIAYDCRHHSREFAELAARILAGAGIHVFLFPSLRPTPELSYTVRKLGCISGINMTASHNPKEYNGYKVYWEDGAQISGSVSEGISARIEALDLFGDFEALPLEKAKEAGLVTMLGREMDEDYLNYVLSLRQREDDELDLSVPVVYTPLNGAGSIPFTEMAQRRHFSGFHIVTEQKDPDPDFNTVPYPNPEEPAAFELARKLGREVGAEVLIATDPDSDRMAIEIADWNGGYRFLNGNQTGAMLIAYLAQSHLENNSLSKRTDPGQNDEMSNTEEKQRAQSLNNSAHKRLSGKPAMIKSIVTGDFGRTICDAYGIRVFETLTGFKNICGKIPEILKEGYSYFFGYEESIGCAPGVEVRDKDGISAGMLIMEMAAWYRKKGMTLRDALENLYQTYGYFAEEQISLVLKGKEGADKMTTLMNAIRRYGQEKPADSGISEMIDYIHGYHINKYEDIPPQNALKFVMEDGSWFAVRPSGTEPKIKFYYYSVSNPDSGSMEESRKKIEGMKKLVETMTTGLV